MKRTLKARPVFVNTPGHIHAHLLKWSYGMSGERLSVALREWQALRQPGECYQMLNSSGEDIRRVLSALGVGSGKRIYTKGGIAALKSSVGVF